MKKSLKSTAKATRKGCVGGWHVIACLLTVHFWIFVEIAEQVDTNVRPKADDDDVEEKNHKQMSSRVDNALEVPTERLGEDNDLKWANHTSKSPGVRIRKSTRVV